ncbi:class D sortase [Paenibacillus sp. SI8]|uniref:class D sortase n=1 Tax=unclassified Paenibacillus TaxID=185978 RepID=UPI003466A631
MKRLSYVLFFVGLILLLFPLARESYDDWQQEQLLKQALPLVQDTRAVEDDNSLKIANEQLTQLLNPAAEIQEQESVPQATAPTPEEPASEQQKVAIAIIKIDKINVKLPVLEGATEQNMRFAATHMKETTPIGEIGNAAIAAHRARTTGRLFNRLDELEIGDQITISVKGIEKNYTVYKKVIVDPSDISVLNGNDKDSVLTLITCDPIVNATHRLIVQAKLVG